MSLSLAIQSFIHRAIQEGFVDPLDQLYIQNRLLSLLKLDALKIEENHRSDIPSLLDSLNIMCQYAQNQGIIQDLSYEREQFESAIMDLITPTPKQVNDSFWLKYQQSPQLATDYFYQLSQANNYIKTRHIAKNIVFKTAYPPYGDLHITINLSKPEKDPKEIALARKSSQNNYPACLLCMENEGYQGRYNHPARQQHRIIRMSLKGQPYGMQYSPYSYYQEHAIFLSADHVPMSINRQTFDNLLSLVQQLPHYFVGSNADLPIVGGSILSHDHYQGGRYTFPLDKATAFQHVHLRGFEDLQVQLVKWPMSVIRIIGSNPSRVAQAGEALYHFWQTYSDIDSDILAYTDQIPHNTVTPIARRRNQDFELDIVLRNNRTSPEFPDGIFHPHSDVHHIKKENIGLIEVMGLAILPPRLLTELEDLKAYLANKAPLSNIASYHQDWAKELKSLHPYPKEDDIQNILETSIGQKFGRVLEDAGVFKQDTQGKAGFLHFIHSFNHIQ